MKTFISVSALLIFVPAIVLGFENQPSKLRFDSESFDFGAVREEAGVVSCTFTVRNTGDSPIAILSATATCGCTVPTYSKKPLLPGDTGTLGVAYDPANRPGAFDKVVTVITSEQSEPLRLHITGNVIPRPRSSEELYPVYIGSGVRIEDNFHSFAYIEHGKSHRTAIGIINTSKRPVRLTLRPQSGTQRVSWITADAPSVLAAGERGEITIAYELPELCDFYGTVTDVLEFTVDGQVSDAVLTVTGIAVDNRDDVADSRRPKAEFSRNVVKFGTVRHRDRSRMDYFDIANTGTADLHIRRVECGSEGTTLSLRAGDRIARGERRRVEVRIEPSRKDYGPIVERVRLITDDPDRPMRDVKVTMIVDN